MGGEVKDTPHAAAVAPLDSELGSPAEAGELAHPTSWNHTLHLKYQGAYRTLTFFWFSFCIFQINFLKNVPASAPIRKQVSERVVIALIALLCCALHSHLFPKHRSPLHQEQRSVSCRCLKTLSP